MHLSKQTAGAGILAKDLPKSFRQVDLGLVFRFCIRINCVPTEGVVVGKKITLNSLLCRHYSWSKTFQVTCPGM